MPDENQNVQLVDNNQNEGESVTVRVNNPGTDQPEPQPPVENSAPEPEVPATTESPIPASPQPEPTLEPEPQTGFPSETPLIPARNPRKKLWIIVTAAAVIVIGLAAWWVFGRSEPPVEEAASPQVSKPATLGIALTYIEGSVEFSTDGQTWQAATSETQIGENNWLRTGKASRAILTLDDGSAVRLNGSARIKLAALNVESVLITNEQGQVYSRVTPSDDRTFVISTGNDTYSAQGTAFKTTNQDDKKGVDVYQSSVKVNEQTEVKEGQGFYTKTKDGKYQDKAVKLSLDALKKDEFLKWNREQDQKEDEFKDALGVLKDWEGPKLSVAASSTSTTDSSVTISGTTEKSAKVSVNDKAIEVDGSGKFSTSISLVLGSNTVKAVATDTAGNKTSKTLSVTRKEKETAAANISISQLIEKEGGIKVLWSVKDGYDVSGGFKVTYSQEQNPSYPGDSAVYADADATYAFIEGSGLEDGKVYYVRVCAYKSGSCVSGSYSAQKSIEAPVE